MTTRTPEQTAAWNRWHAIVAALLTLLLVLLWLTGRGPGSTRTAGACCGDVAPAAVATTPVPAAPIDSDGDGVLDPDDACPGTLAGTAVDARGCEVVAAVEPAPVEASVPPAANLYFELDVSALPADGPSALASIAEYLTANPGAAAVVSGYHDPTGNREHNLELAKNRAKSVRDHLVAAGVAESQVELLKPIETTGTGSLEEARRVEVSIRQ